MVRKDSVILVRDAVTDSAYANACIEEDIQVICVNRETGNKKYMSSQIMYGNNNRFWVQNEVWEYFISKDDHAKILEVLSEKPVSPNIEIVGDTGKPAAEPDKGLGKRYETISKMPDKERALIINESKKKLEKLITLKPRNEEVITEALVETGSETIMHNHASLMNALSLADDEAKKQTQEMVNSTRDLVKSSVKLISDNIFNDDLMNTLVAKSNGTIIQHMTRVYINGLAFLSYYNKFVSGSSVINKMRIDFDKKYKYYYEKLLNHMNPDQINLQTVFLGGMRIIPENDLYNWALGFMVHDIGKAGAVEYHEGEAAYNRDIVIEHVKI